MRDRDGIPYFVTEYFFLAFERNSLTMCFPPPAPAQLGMQRMSYVWKTREARILLLGLSFLFSLSPGLLFGSVTLQIPDVNLPDGKVEFRPGICDSAAVLAAPAQQMPQSTTSNYTVQSI
jgi:hypothetical protein